MRKQIAVFGSARVAPDQPLYHQTERACELLARRGYKVATGGGPGLMEAANKGALNVCSEQLCSLAYSIYLPFEAETNSYVQHDSPHETFHTRLQQFCEENDGFIALPGGYGTLLEIMMVVQLKQVSHMDKPIILVGNMWRVIMDTASDLLLAKGYIDVRDRYLYLYADTPEEAANLMLVHLGEPSNLISCRYNE